MSANTDIPSKSEPVLLRFLRFWWWSDNLTLPEERYLERWTKLGFFCIGVTLLAIARSIRSNWPAMASALYIVGALITFFWWIQAQGIAARKRHQNGMKL